MMHRPTARKSTMVVVLVALLLLACQAQRANAMIFQFINTDPICFVEEVLPETNAVTGTYAWQGSQATAGVVLTMKVTDPSGVPVATPKPMERGFHNIRVPLPRGHAAGRYLLCASITLNPSKVNLVESPVMVEFMIDQSVAPLTKDDEALFAVRKRVQGKEVFTFTEHGGEQKDILQPAEYLETITRALRETDRGFQQLKHGMNSYFERQERMRRTTESTFTRVWVCAAFTIVFIAIVVFVQFRMLKTTIKRKKLI